MKRSTNGRAHSALKSVPKMEKDHKVTQILDGIAYTFHEGYNSVMRRLIKKRHKKKRRQYFRGELRGHQQMYAVLNDSRE